MSLFIASHLNYFVFTILLSPVHFLIILNNILTCLKARIVKRMEAAESRYCVMTLGVVYLLGSLVLPISLCMFLQKMYSVCIVSGYEF